MLPEVLCGCVFGVAFCPSLRCSQSYSVAAFLISGGDIDHCCDERDSEEAEDERADHGRPLLADQRANDSADHEAENESDGWFHAATFIGQEQKTKADMGRPWRGLIEYLPYHAWTSHTTSIQISGSATTSQALPFRWIGPGLVELLLHSAQPV